MIGLLIPAIFAVMISHVTNHEVARFITIEPPILFQPHGTTTCGLDPIDAEMPWDEAIVSWNVQPATGADFNLEARVVYADHTTKWYTLGHWSLDGARQSVDGQKDDDGTVKTDTLSMKRHGGLLQLRLTGQTSNKETKLTFLGVSFSDTTASGTDTDHFQPALGKTITVPARYQADYPRGGSLCSPTAVSMLLWHYSGLLKRPELNQDVPAIENGVWDPVYKGAGNWPFNMAYAASFPGMTAYVTRLASISELEQWTAAGFPVACSVSNQLLHGKSLDRATEEGHLVVLVGFTLEGDPVFNDPNSRITPTTYKRSDFEGAWDYSHRTVYLIYPTGSKIPESPHERWAANKTE